MDKESNQKCSQRNGHTQATEKGQEMNRAQQNYLRYDETTVICRKKMQKCRRNENHFGNNRLGSRLRGTKKIIHPCSRVLPRGKK